MKWNKIWRVGQCQLKKVNKKLEQERQEVNSKISAILEEVRKSITEEDEGKECKRCTLKKKVSTEIIEITLQKKGECEKCDVCKLKDEIKELKEKKEEEPMVNQYYYYFAMACIVLGILFNYFGY